ncbi:serine acetyltransferase [candidate division KSB1 bacterium]|nr:serine acetyltransferase [candidate division KSB1 bacterium]
MVDSAIKMTRAAKNIVRTYDQHGGVNRIDGKNLPTTQHVAEVLDDLMRILFPGYFESRVPARSHILFFVQGSIDSIYLRLADLVTRALQFECKDQHCDTCERLAEEKALEFIESIPHIRVLLKMDVRAGYEGDPAATSTEEIILCYPFIYAIAVHRIAHVLYKAQIPLIPRMMSEWAHRRTGIDIHPGAQIGKRFFIDHGSGVVIGETTEIGNDVKIYQGVTLGALSFPKNPDGTVVKGGKRHPTIRDRVTLYSGATILGGTTIIGEDSVIGANTWITFSVPPHTLVTFQEQQTFRSLQPRSAKTDPAENWFI